jgi:hypothetical protein
MTTRDQIVRTALGFNRTCNGQGYDHKNPFSDDLGRPPEAWCGDFVTDIYKRAQIPLPSMQPGCRTGFAYCPDAADYGRKHDATRYSEPLELVQVNLARGRRQNVSATTGEQDTSPDRLAQAGDVGLKGPSPQSPERAPPTAPQSAAQPRAPHRGATANR